MARPTLAKRLDDRIDIRTQPEIKKTIQRAAESIGSDISKFIITYIYEEAKRILAEQESFELSLRDRDIFLAAIDNPSDPNASLKKSLKKYKNTVE